MKLTPQLLFALSECESYSKRSLYWFREASMRKLEAMGMVEQFTPPSVAERPRMKRRPWRIIDAGRQALKDEVRG